MHEDVQGGILKLLGRGDEKALDRMGVKNVEELLSFADVSGDPKLSVNEVEERRGKEDFPQC